MLGSIQCTSSKSTSTGVRRGEPVELASSASKVRSRLRCGVSAGRGVAAAGRERQQLGQQRHVLARAADGRRQQRLELVELRARADRRARSRPPARAGDRPGAARLSWRGGASRSGAGAACGSPPSRSRSGRGPAATCRSRPRPRAARPGPRRSLARSQRSSRSASSCSRPTSGVGRRPRAAPRNGSRPRRRRATRRPGPAPAKPLSLDGAEVGGGRTGRRGAGACPRR